VNNWF